jgi:cyclic pyranopterin phosphate synthase
MFFQPKKAQLTLKGILFLLSALRRCQIHMPIYTQTPKTTHGAPSSPLLDARGRVLRDVRISLTDHCNLRCTYCMPKDRSGYSFLPSRDLLSFEEIGRLVTALVTLGLRKVKLTGGEPLLRRNLSDLVGQLRASHPDLEINLITNGVLLPAVAIPLRAAGLTRLTVSLDGLRPQGLQAMSGRGNVAARALDGIEAALNAGFAPLKINMVVIRGVNDDEVEAMAARFRGPHTILRFIEYMDVGTLNRWQRADVVPSAEILSRLRRQSDLLPVDPAHRGETARRYRYADGSGEIGFISSVTEPFCGDCNRLRVTADGTVHTCLFSSAGPSLRPYLAQGDGDRLLAMLSTLWRQRRDQYSVERSQVPARHKLEMFSMGG